eukprot:GFUD01003899.1.p1 GENE.GFUD01003899.1~~GFUD01003899.1.p1  ORF type:complete len:772 (+),score=154.39 GFUD01003899.1:38-2353(+)
MAATRRRKKELGDMTNSGNKSFRNVQVKFVPSSENIIDLSILNNKSKVLNNETDFSDTVELETYSDPSCTSATISDGDKEYSFGEMEDILDTSYESSETSPISLSGSDYHDLEHTLLNNWEFPGISAELSFESENSIPVSSPKHIGSFDSEFFLEKGSSNSLNLENKIEQEMAEEITEGFSRLKDLVKDLLTVDPTKEEMQTNVEFMQGLLKQFSINLDSDSNENWSSVPMDNMAHQVKGQLNTSEEIQSFERKKAQPLNSFSHAEIEYGHDIVNLPPPLSSDSCALNSISSADTLFSSKPIVETSSNVLCSKTSNNKQFNFLPDMKPAVSLADSPSRSVETSSSQGDKPALYGSPFTSNTTMTSALSPPGKAEVPRSSSHSVDIPASDCHKSRYELIREEIIAERNAQLKAMGFFEEFAALRSEVEDPKKPSKVKGTKNKCKREAIRRSERLFLSTPVVDKSSFSGPNTAFAKEIISSTSAIVMDIIEEAISSACQDRIILDAYSCPFTCEVCGKYFEKRKYLSEHNRIIHSKAFNFHCNHCDYKTYGSRNLLLHMKEHSTSSSEAKYFTPKEVISVEINKVYKCDQCSYETNQKRSLLDHRARVHKPTSILLNDVEGLDNEETAKGKFDKKEGDSKKIELESDSDSDSVNMFTDDSDEETHESPVKKQRLTFGPVDQQVSSTDQVWSCDTCDRVYKSKWGLKMHMKGKHSTYKSKCSDCEFESPTNYYLQKHKILVHNYEKKFSCEDCNFFAIISGDLKKHRLRYHSVN